MKYCVLYTINDYGVREYFIKGKSVEHIEDRIKAYSDGFLSTNKWTLLTSNIENGYLREINLSEFPDKSKKDFSIINENNSFSSFEINSADPDIF